MASSHPKMGPPFVSRDRPITVLIADDHPMVLQGLVGILRPYDDIEIVAECANGHEALKFMNSLSPDLAILDMAMPGMTGLEVLSSTPPMIHTRVVLLTASATDREIITALERGATGILHKDGALEEIVHCIRSAAAGQQWLSSTITEVIAEYRRAGQSPKMPEVRLTQREQEVMRFVARGLSNKEIARQLDVSEGTVKIHLHKIFQKLGVTNRTALATFAMDHPG